MIAESKDPFVAPDQRANGVFSVRDGSGRSTPSMVLFPDVTAPV